MSSDGDDGKRGRANTDEIVRLLADPSTLNFLATLRGISLEEARERVREIIEALELARPSARAGVFAGALSQTMR